MTAIIVIIPLPRETSLIKVAESLVDRLFGLFQTNHPTIRHGRKGSQVDLALQKFFSASERLANLGYLHMVTNSEYMFIMKWLHGYAEQLRAQSHFFPASIASHKTCWRSLYMTYWSKLTMNIRRYVRRHFKQARMSRLNQYHPLLRFSNFR